MGGDTDSFEDFFDGMEKETLTKVYVSSESQSPEGFDTYSDEKGDFFLLRQENIDQNDVEDAAEVLDEAGGPDVDEGEAIEALREALGMDHGKAQKGRIYIDDPSEAPEDANVEEGAQGGYYYEYDDTRDEQDTTQEDLMSSIEEALDEGHDPEEIQEHILDETDEEPESVLEQVIGGISSILRADDPNPDVERVFWKAYDTLSELRLEKQRGQRVYIEDPDDAPDMLEVHEGPRGGYFYISEPEQVNLDPERDVDEVILELVQEYYQVYGTTGLEDLDFWSTELMEQVDAGEIQSSPEEVMETVEIGDSDDTTDSAGLVNSVLNTFGREGLERLDYWTNRVMERNEEE